MFVNFFRILFILILPFSVFSLNANEIENQLKKDVIEEILQKTPRNVAEVHQYVDTACLKAEKLADKILSHPLEKATFDNTIRVWNKIGEIYFESLAFLHGIEAVTTDPLVIEAGESGCEKLKHSIAKLLYNTELLDRLVSFIELSIDNPNLTPSEKYYFQAFLSESDDVENPELKERLSELKKSFNEEMMAYSPYFGNAPLKKEKGKTFTVLNWNVCFLPGVLSLAYGGMLPWEYRFDKVVEFIKNSEADVICLQEVYQEESAIKLYEALKDEYAYFYINIAPKNFGFNPNHLSLGSGLFVASKYEIPKAFWAKYTDSWRENITRGFFDFEIQNGDLRAQIVTTHLDASLSWGSAENFRALQLKQVLNHLDEKKKRNGKKNTPVIICGDLNIYWGYSEPAEGLIKKFFYNPYNEETKVPYTSCDFTGYWWPEYFKNKERKKFEPEFVILDYALLLKAIPSGEQFSYNHVSETTVLQAFPENPESALSDHHALLTTFFWKPSLK